MKNDITAIKLSHPPPKKEVVECLEELLNLAKSGELQSIAYVGNLGRGYTQLGWEGIGKDIMQFISGIEVLKLDMMWEFVDMKMNGRINE